MDLPVEHLSTFSAIVDEGSFEGAARRLHITPSAVSQRVKNMEQRLGSVLLRRSRPIELTQAGSTVLRVARQLERITDDAARELGLGPGTRTVLPIVVNADSLATWFVPAIARAAKETGAFFEIVRADETVSTERLRSGEVVAALTATSEPVPGCTSTLLGIDRYRAVASPEFVARHFSEGTGAETLRTAPMIEFDRHDIFQQRFIRRITRVNVAPPRHMVPSSHEFALAIELGLGWGMVPELQCREAIDAGRLVELQPNSTIELPLFWQRWNLPSPLIDQLSDIVSDEASRALSQR
ncbi:MAG: LysR family transcriptional regulator ArgP [Actinobacteria bacterium]|nr:LysR family transcriptional regulator ArgP [Actinomycetota bacterium]